MSHRSALRLVPVALVPWAAGIAAIFVPLAAPFLAAGLWVIVLGAVACAVAAWAMAARTAPRPRPSARTGRARRLVVVLVLALGAAAATASHVALAQPGRLALSAAALGGGRALVVDATVVGKIEGGAAGRFSFDAVATSFTVGQEMHPAHLEVVVRAAPSDVSSLDLLDVGALVQLRGTASTAHAGERAVLVVAARHVEVRRPATGAAAVASDLRRGLVDATAGLPGAGAGLVPGLAVGDTSAVSAGLDAAMKESSLSHLTAVSGANCALVVGLAFAVAAGLGAPRAVRVAAGLAALVGFVVLVTPEPSVVRAGAMAGIAMLGLLLGRPGAGLSILSLAVALLLIADPWLAGSLGFALSATATASLLLFARPLAAGLARGLPRGLALALSIPLAAQLACGPLLILITPQVPVYGVLANLLAGPAAPAATLLGLAACLAAPLPWLQNGLAALAWVPASWIAATATTVSTLPADLLPWIEGWPGAVALAIVGIAIGLLIAARRDGGRGRRLTRLASGALVAVVAGGMCGGAALASVAGRWTLPPGWTVLACDVGQGDAVLLRSGTAVALIDTGPAPEPLAACLSRVGVDRVDLLVLTHFDQDHIGGLAAVTGRVGTVLHGPAEAAHESVLASVVAGGARAIPAHAGVRGTLGEAQWRVLWPTQHGRGYPPGNDASIVLDVRGGGIPPTLLLGDLSASPQRAVAASGALDPPYAIIKVAHHGSADQDAALYAEVVGAVALITVGEGNDYGHPRAEILDVLTQAGSVVARTDLDGVVALWATGGAVSVWRERGG